MPVDAFKCYNLGLFLLFNLQSITCHMSHFFVIWSHYCEGGDVHHELNVICIDRDTPRLMLDRGMTLKVNGCMDLCSE